MNWKERGPHAVPQWVIGERLVVVHRRVGCGERWFLTCDRMNIQNHDLRQTNIEEARDEAILVVRSTLMDIRMKFGFLLQPGA